jgi:hypothetical protein
MTDLEVSAQRLIDCLDLPHGAVSALGYSDASGPYIRLLIDPQYWLCHSDVPQTFGGYRIRTEKRTPATAHG